MKSDGKLIHWDDIQDIEMYKKPTDRFEKQTLFTVRLILKSAKDDQSTPENTIEFSPGLNNLDPGILFSWLKEYHQRYSTH